jgi:2-haloacid dehalogenase
MRYPFVLLDLDHTLIDSATAERTAFQIVAAEAGLSDAPELMETYLSINHGLWKAVERGETTPDEVRRTRFDHFLAEIGIEGDGHAMSERYAHALAEETDLFPEAREVLERLAASATLAMVTNGLSDVQRTRIARLDLEQYFDQVVISGEIGHTKPGAEIFRIVFDRLGGPAKEQAVMIGDSLTSDVAGGNGFGIDTCWFNPTGAEYDGIVPTHVVSRLDQLPHLVASGGTA